MLLRDFCVWHAIQKFLEVWETQVHDYKDMVKFLKIWLVSILLLLLSLICYLFRKYNVYQPHWKYVVFDLGKLPEQKDFSVGLPDRVRRIWNVLY